jgi:hypothetical protein
VVKCLPKVWAWVRQEPFFTALASPSPATMLGFFQLFEPFSPSLADFPKRTSSLFLSHLKLSSDLMHVITLLYISQPLCAPPWTFPAPGFLLDVKTNLSAVFSSNWPSFPGRQQHRIRLKAIHVQVLLGLASSCHVFSISLKPRDLSYHSTYIEGRSSHLRLRSVLQYVLA